MLIDLHAHSSGISRCCQLPAPDILKAALEAGLDGIVLTNHYQRYYLDGGKRSAADFAKDYVREYEYAKEWGDKLGCRVFFGLEITPDFWTAVHLLAYGVSTDFVLEYPEVFACSQKELYELIHANGGALVQAHPFRNDCHVLDTDYLDGVEINCHPLYGKTYQNELVEAAQRAGLMLTCGGDYQADTYRPHCGTYLPDWVQTEKDLARFILTAEEVTLHVQEVNDPQHRDQHYALPRAEKYLK